MRQVTIEAAFITMMNKLVFAQDIMLDPLYMALKSDARRNGISEINRIQEKMEENTSRRHQLRSMMTQGLLDADIFNDENNTLLSEYDDMEKNLYRLKSEINSELIHIKELEKLMVFTKKREILESYDDELFIEHVDYLIAYSQTKIGFVLKCGLTLVEEVDV